MTLRWRVALLVCVAIAISYLDRQSLPVAVAAIQRDIPLTNTQFGALSSVFCSRTRWRMPAAACSSIGSAPGAAFS
jgi:sugar phosphate permease